MADQRICIVHLFSNTDARWKNNHFKDYRVQ